MRLVSNLNKPSPSVIRRPSMRILQFINVEIYPVLRPTVSERLYELLSLAVTLSVSLVYYSVL